MTPGAGALAAFSGRPSALGLGVGVVVVGLRLWIELRLAIRAYSSEFQTIPRERIPPLDAVNGLGNNRLFEGQGSGPGGGAGAAGVFACGGHIASKKYEQ